MAIPLNPGFIVGHVYSLVHVTQSLNCDLPVGRCPNQCGSAASTDCSMQPRVQEIAQVIRSSISYFESVQCRSGVMN